MHQRLAMALLDLDLEDVYIASAIMSICRNFSTEVRAFSYTRRREEQGAGSRKEQ